MPITPNAAVISANNDPALDRVLSRDNQTIVFSDDGAVILNTDRNVQVNLFEQLVQQNYITSVTEVNNPGGNIDGEIQLKDGANFGASANLIFDRNSGILRISKIATDNLLYSNGAGWDFSQGTGIAYSNLNVEQWLNTGANAPVSLARGANTGNANILTNVIIANTFQYSNGSPLFIPYGDENVSNLLNSGENAGVIIENIQANGNITANANIITYQSLYVRPSSGGNPAGNTSAIVPGLPTDSDLAVTNIYNIGSPSRAFKNLYANGTVFASAANIQGPVTVTGSITSNSSIYANSGTIGAANIISTGNITAVGANVTGNITAAAANIGAITTGAIIGNSLNLPGFISNTNATTFYNAVTLGITANLTAAVTQFQITGGNAGQFLRTAGNGTVSWANVVTSAIVNGNSNIVGLFNGNITVSVNNSANVAVFTSTGANLANLSVAGNSYLGNASAVTILGGSANYVLSTDGQGNLSWQQGGTTNFYSGNAAAANSIATNSQINAVLPAGITARNGDIFMDTNSAAQNQQPVYISVNGQWRQFLTAFGGL